MISPQPLVFHRQGLESSRLHMTVFKRWVFHFISLEITENSASAVQPVNHSQNMGLTERVAGLPAASEAEMKLDWNDIIDRGQRGIGISEEEAIAMANDTEYGLAAALWTEDLKQAHRAAQSVEAGIAWVNTWFLRDLRTPFGGVKNSGIGREGGRYSLDFYSESKNICIKM